MECKDCGTRARKLTAPGPRCSSCHKANDGDVGARNHANSVWRNYGVSGEEYYKLLDRQGGVCLFCDQPPTTRRLAVDHDHRCCPSPTPENPTCGLCNRSALLCFSCNTVLGKAENAFPEDNLKLLKRMVEYLERTNENGMDILLDIRHGQLKTDDSIM